GGSRPDETRPVSESGSVRPFLFSRHLSSSRFASRHRTLCRGSCDRRCHVLRISPGLRRMGGAPTFDEQGAASPSSSASHLTFSLKNVPFERGKTPQRRLPLPSAPSFVVRGPGTHTFRHSD